MHLKSMKPLTLSAFYDYESNTVHTKAVGVCAVPVVERTIDPSTALADTKTDESFARSLIKGNSDLQRLVQNLFIMVPKDRTIAPLECETQQCDEDGYFGRQRSLSVDEELECPINQNMYFAFSAHLFKRLVPVANASQCERLLRAQWDVDTLTTDGVLPYNSFIKVIAMTMEHWCRSTDPEDYFTFIRDIFTPAFFNISSCDPLKPFNFGHLYGEKRKKSVELLPPAPHEPVPEPVKEEEPKKVFKPLSKRLEQLSKPRPDQHEQHEQHGEHQEERRGSQQAIVL